MSDIDDLKTDPNQAASELLYPADTNGDGLAAVGSPADPSARGDGSSTTGILHGATADDLSPEALETLGQYLGEWTKSNITSVSANPGTATPIVDPSQRSGQTYHAVQDSKFFSAEAYNWDAGEKLTPTTQYSDGDHTANTMLRDVVANAPGWGAPLNALDSSNSGPGIPQQTVSAVLTQNRFMQGDPANTGENDGVSTKKYMLTQRQALDTGDSTIGRYNAAADGVALDDLTSMADRLLKAAAGEAGAQGFGESALPSRPQWAPGIPGFGGMIETSDVSPIKQLQNAMITADGDDVRALKIAEKDIGTPLPSATVSSYGQLNHPDETFGGLPLGMIIVAVVSALALAVISLVTALLLDVFGTGNFGFPPENIASNSPPHNFPKGNRHGKKTSQIMAELHRWMGVAQLKNDYGTGFLSWFKFTRACLAGLAVFWLPQIFFSSGYYAAVHRNALRDIEQVEIAMGKLAGGEIDPIAGIYLLIEAFTSSATFRFTNVLISLGDLILAKGGFGAYGMSKWNTDQETTAASDQIPSNLSTLHSKTREGQNSSKHSLRLSNLPFRLIRPSNANFPVLPAGVFAKAQEDQESPAGTTPLGVSAENFFYQPENGRISTEDRKDLERELNSYFMPFYFHDLRTNEILSFHSFVESISDSFSPEYTQVKGFGRMDPVQIYKSTTRKIGFSFWIVAMDEDDTTTMWYVINRLVSMVYPQWTVGDVRTNAEDQKFVVPFSQTVGASPLLRLRLGNLFRSNIAPKSIKRLFGVGDPATFDVASDDPMNQNREVDSAELDTAMADLERNYNMTGDDIEAEWANFALNYLTNIATGWKITDSPFPLVYNTKGAAPGSSFSASKKRLYPVNADVTAPGGFSFLAKEDQGLWPVVQGFESVSLMITCTVQNYFVAAPYEEGDKIGYIVTTDYSGNDFGAYASGEESGEFDAFFVPIEWAQNTNGTSTTQANREFLTEQLALSDTIDSQFSIPDTFFTPTENIIVRSFEESGGEGLAGVITNLDFDWNAAPWDIRGEVRAPQYCKVTLGFSPIHDIAPGLAADGSMRASVYPVNVDKIFGEPGATSESGREERAARRAAWRARRAKWALGKNPEIEDPGELE